MKKKIGAVITLLFLISFLCPVIVNAQSEFSCFFVTEIPQTECEALVALYNSTNGDSWTSSENWLVTYFPSNWYGVSVNTGHVISLYLGGNHLTNMIPEELSSLSYLIELSLSNNELIGTIPPELGNLTRLENLVLQMNDLSGAIPPELGNLSSLSSLLLDYNQLSGTIPSELGNLSNVHYLTLSGNQLSGTIPRELGNLSNLQYLLLYVNQLSGTIPAELGNLTNLLYLHLFGNNLSGTIPPELGNLINLENLQLQQNQLSGEIPSELGNLNNLQDLLLYFNQLTGVIPSALGNLTSLQHLDLRFNQLRGTIPPDFGYLSNLQYLYLTNNPLTGAIPLQLINIPLWSFHFDETHLCEPSDVTFQNWISTISDYQGTGWICGTSLIEGHVRQLDENGLAEVEISLGNFSSTFTDSNGHFSFSVEPGGTYNLSAKKNGYCFSPQFWSVTILEDTYTYDFTAFSGDCIPPSAINNLSASTGNIPNSIILSWTATGDDENVGTASTNDLRYSASPITEANFPFATSVDPQPVPLSAGSNQTTEISMPFPGLNYYFALKAKDEAGNWSPISNIANATSKQPADTTPPGRIVNLAARPGPQPGQVILTWTAPAEDGYEGDPADHYNARYGGTYITSSWWNNSESLSGEPAPGIPGTVQSWTFTDSDFIAGREYAFAIKSYDEAGNVSGMSNIAKGKVASQTTSYPDLSINNLSLSSISVNPGDTLTVDFQITNIGTAPARPFTASIYLTTTLHVDPSKEVCSKRISSGLSAGNQVPINCNVQIPADYGAGNYYILVLVDSHSEVVDPVTSNNSTHQIIHVFGTEDSVNLSVKGIEVTQGIQVYHLDNPDFHEVAYGNPPIDIDNPLWTWTAQGPGNNGLHLVSGKAIAIRVYIAIDHAFTNQREIGVKLAYNIGGDWKYAIPFDGQSGNIAYAYLTGEEADSDLRPEGKKSANFLIPQEDVVEGILQIRYIVDPETAIPETNEMDNEGIFEYPTPIIEAESLRIGLIPITVYIDGIRFGEGDIYDTNMIDQETYATHFLPVNINYTILFGNDLLLQISTADPVIDILDIMLNLQFFNGFNTLYYSDEYDVYVGVLPASLYDFIIPRTTGMSTWIGSGHSIYVMSRNSANGHRIPSFAMTHELSHLIPGLRHVRNTPGNDAPSTACFPFYIFDLLSTWPYGENYNLNETIFNHEYGFYSNSSLFDHNSKFYQDIMSYCNNLYLSPYSWESWINHPGPNFEIAKPLAEPGVFFAVSGSVDNNNQVTFRPVWTENEPVAIESGSGDYCVQGLNAENNIISSQCFDLSFYHHDFGMLNEIPFSASLPFDPLITKIQMTKQGSLMGEITSSAHLPTVEVSYPNSSEILDGPITISWTGTDEDDQDLTYKVLFSPDNGTSWVPLTTELPNTWLTIDPDTLPGTVTGLVKVIASDGFYTTEDISDANFTILSKSPTANIVSPQNGSKETIGSVLTFISQGNDPEDSTILESNYRWTSNLDGEFGTSKSIQTNNLTPGIHLITLTVTDSDGNSTSDSINLEILADSDSDGMPDQWEIENGLDPTIDDSNGDCDEDGIKNLQEFLFKTDPFNFDTDLDGIDDLTEILNGTDPLVTNYNTYLYLPVIVK